MHISTITDSVGLELLPGSIYYGLVGDSEALYPLKPQAYITSFWGGILHFFSTPPHVASTISGFRAFLPYFKWFDISLSSLTWVLMVNHNI